MHQGSIDIYRKFVYGDANMPHPIPAGLEALHDEIWQLQKFAFHQSQMSNDGHLVAFVTWKYHTDEGRKFYNPDIDDEDDEEVVETPEAVRFRLPKGTAVDVSIPGFKEYSGVIRGHGTKGQAGLIQVIPDDGHKRYCWVPVAHIYRRNAKPLAVG